jgi:hypothetical protein
MVELYFIVMSVTAVVLAGALSLILYLDRIPRCSNNDARQSPTNNVSQPTQQERDRCYDEV